MEIAYVERFTGAIKALVVPCLILNTVIRLVVTPTAKQVNIPFTGEARLQACLSSILDHVAHRQLLFSKRHGESLAQAHCQRPQRTRSPHKSLACQRDSDA